MSFAMAPRRLRYEPVLTGMTPGSAPRLTVMGIELGRTDAKPPARTRVLVVEDDPAGAQLLHDQLEVLGYSSDCALDGNRALMMADSGQYGAMLLDLHIPAYDGVEVLHMLRKRLLLRPIKVIVITGDAAGTRRSDLNREGIDAYLTKPVDLTVLARELARATVALKTA